ncbi:uncharacterized protein LOC141535195 [Cotesia typhae]|uniref:uncharacterized protein LOC141535195 n=1 Tax=Cotesia typhae TaxID=2053667 RepID=UPI003D6986E5
MMKQCQESLLGAQAAVAKMEKIQGLIIDEFNKQKDVFVEQTKTLEDKNNEIRKQTRDVNNECSKMHEHYQKLVDRDESRSNGGTFSSELGELKNQVSKLVQQEFKKLKVDRSVSEFQNSDNLANKIKETLKVEIISKDGGMQRDYKLTPNTKFEHFYDLFTSELRVHELLYVIDPTSAPRRDLDTDIIEKHKFKVRNILVNHLNHTYHSQVIGIKDPVELLNTITDLKKTESNNSSSTLRRLLHSMQYYPNKEKASDFIEKFEDVVRNYGNLSGIKPLSELEKKDAFYSAIMTTVPNVQSVEFMTMSSTGQGLSYEKLKLFILQAEANKNHATASETTGTVMQAYKDVIA